MQLCPNPDMNLIVMFNPIPSRLYNMHFFQLLCSLGMSKENKIMSSLLAGLPEVIRKPQWYWDNSLMISVWHSLLKTVANSDTLKPGSPERKTKYRNYGAKVAWLLAGFTVVSWWAAYSGHGEQRTQSVIACRATVCSLYAYKIWQIHAKHSWIRVLALCPDVGEISLADFDWFIFLTLPGKESSTWELSI